METPRSFLPTRGKSLPMRGKYKRKPYDDDDDDLDDDWTRQQLGSTSTSNCNRLLSFDRSLSERGQVLKIRTHAPLEKIAKFEGRRCRSTKLSSGLRRSLTR